MSPNTDTPVVSASLAPPSDTRVPKESPGVLGRLLHSLRPPLKRTYTASQLSTLRKSKAGSSSSHSSSSKARSRRSNSSSSRRPSSVRSVSDSHAIMGSSASRGGPSSSSPGVDAVLMEDNENPALKSARSSAEYVNTRYSPTGSLGYEQSVSETASRHTTRQASPLASPPEFHRSRNPSASNLQLSSGPSSNAAPLAGPSSSTSPISTSTSSRPGLGRRQSSARGLGDVLRPLFRRSSSQKESFSKPTLSQSSKIQPLSSSRPSTATGSAAAPPSDRSASSLGGPTRPGTASTTTASGPPSPAVGTSGHNRRQFTVSSATTHSASSSHAASATTPLAAVDTSRNFPSPFFAQSTPTTNPPNPFGTSIDCIPVLTAALSKPITSTLAQLVPLSLISPYGSSQPYCTSHGLGSLPGASTTSLASSSISETATSSSTHHTAGSSIHPSNISQHSTASSSISSAFVSNEQLAASSLSVPTTAIATIWRLAKAQEWIAQHGSAINSLIACRNNPMTPRAISTPPGGPVAASYSTSSGQSAEAEASEGPTVFDFAALLQSVLDVLAPTTGEKGIDVVYFHGARHLYYSQSGIRRESSTTHANRDEQHEVQEAFVRADEKGLGLAILIMLRQVLADLSYGTTLEIGLSIALSLPSTRPPAGKKAEQDLSSLSPDSGEDDSDDENVRLGTYILTVEISTSLPSSDTTSSTSPSGHAGYHNGDANLHSHSASDLKVDSSICSALFQYLHLSFLTLPRKEDRQEYKITCALPQGRPPSRYQPTVDAASRRRKSMDQSKEPSLSELVRFADNSLRGKKVALHALEHSTFAHHLSHHLANWGLEVTHVSVAPEDDTDATDGRPRGMTASLRSEERGHLGRLDSGFGGSDGPSPLQAAGTPAAVNMSGDPMASAFASLRSDGSLPPSTSYTANMPFDPTLNFIIIDDDVNALRKQILAIKANAPTLQLQNALLAKRPQLQSRRTRSTQAVQRIAQTPVSIIHFTTLAHYRQIKDLVHATLRTASPMFALPEVMVVPKPAGPRRILNTLYNAIRRPPFDPHFTPIATSPSSPGAHYFFTGSRPSPAPSNQNEFDAAAAVELSRQRNEQSLSATVSQVSGPRTPPVPGQVSNPPSPASPDAMEYFSKSASELGTNASQGIIIQSPDGRPTGLFFQPRAASLAEKAESLRMSRNGDSDSSSDKDIVREGSSTQSTRAPRFSPVPAQFQTLTTASGAELPSIVIPENMDLSTGRNFSVSTSKITPQPTPGLAQAVTNSLNSSLEAADNQTVAPAKRNSTRTYANDDRDSSSDSLDKQAGGASDASSSKASRKAIASPPIKSPISPPTERSERQPTLPPIVTTSKTSALSSNQVDTPVSRESQDLVHTPPVGSIRARSDRKSSGKVKKPPRRPTGTLVPPINVLIVEDNPINQIILSTFLKRKGIKHSVAKNGQEAVDQWKAGDFHLVLMDIQLPVKDGIEATQEIRAVERSNNTQFLLTPSSEASNPISTPSSGVASPYELPVIIVALTASNLQSDRVNALAAGCNDFLTKPVSLQWLEKKLVEWGSMAYLSGFSSKRRVTISSPIDNLKRSKSLGSQALELAAQLEAAKIKDESETSK